MIYENKNRVVELGGNQGGGKKGIMGFHEKR